MFNISVCIASYNGESYIKAQLESILIQLSQHDEIIISDDGSTDSTLNVIKSIKDDRIRIVHNTQHHGILQNVENSLRFATRDVIFLSDQDDIWLNEKVNKMAEQLVTYDLVISDCKVTDTHLTIKNDSFFKLRKSGSGLVKNIVKNNYVGCCMAFNRNVLKAALPFPANIPMHDSWIGLVAELVGKVKFLDEPLILYRRHASNASATAEVSKSPLLTKIRWRSILLYELTVRYFKIRFRLHTL